MEFPEKMSEDIYKIRSLLEGLCARWATKNITEQQISDTGRDVTLLSEFHLKRNGKVKTIQVSELDGKFHKVLYEASNSRILEHVLTDFHKYVKMTRQMSVGAPDRAEQSIEEHRAILDAIKDKGC